VPHIVVLGERGIVAQGTYSHLIASNVDMGIDESHSERDLDLDAPSTHALSLNVGEESAPSCNGLEGGCNGLEGGSRPRDAVGRPVVHDGLARMTTKRQAGLRKSALESDGGSQAAAGQVSPANAELIKEEERETGLVKRETYDIYLRSIGQEMLAVVASLGLGSQLARVLIGWWISQVCTCSGIRVWGLGLGFRFAVSSLDRHLKMSLHSNTRALTRDC
jgi:hypothetical protein